MPHYKLYYFNVKALGEPIRLILSYMGKEFEDCRLSWEEWLNLKDKTPFGKLPILEVNGKTYSQSTAILRYLAIEAGLVGNNAEENMEIDMVAGVFGDLVTDVGRCFKTEDPIVKEKLKEKLINETIPFYMKKFGDIMKSNGGYLANGKLSWAELYVIGYSSSLPGLIGIDLTEKYPAFKELVNRVHSLPGIKEWVLKRPETEI